MESWRGHIACLDDRFLGIGTQARNVYSQFGEDGLVGAVLDRIGVKNQWCFEVGAHDGECLSNTRNFREQGWNCLLVESNAEHFGKLAIHASDRVYCVHEHIDRNSLDRLLGDCGAPLDLDFGCIDIDGQDYWAWDGMVMYRPRVMLVEFALNENNGPEDVPALGDTTQRQATIGPILRMGRSKGYTAIAKTYVNAVFVRDSELSGI